MACADSLGGMSEAGSGAHSDATRAFPPPSYPPAGGAGDATPSFARAEGTSDQTGEQPVAPVTIGELGGYRLIERLGSGGMGTVYSALDGDGNRVALKRIHPHIAEEPTSRERLQREVSLLRRVRHLGVAQVLDAEVDAAEAFIVTELIDGPTLEEDVRAHGAFGPDELSGLAHGLAAALRAIHAQGIVHRDLKPSNVMLSGDGPVLIDFGIAQVVDDSRLTQTGMVTGTPGYVDPELIAGAEPDPAHDWWAWAAILLFAASGHAPFGSGTMAAVLARVAAGRADTSGAPASVSDALAAALVPDPGRRLGPDDVLRVIDGHAEGEAVVPASLAGAVGATEVLGASAGSAAGEADAASYDSPVFAPGLDGASDAVSVGPYGAGSRGADAYDATRGSAREAERGMYAPQMDPYGAARSGAYEPSDGYGSYGRGAVSTRSARVSPDLPPIQRGHPPAGQLGQAPAGYGQPPVPYGQPPLPQAYPPQPVWLREPPRFSLTVLLIGLGLSPLAAVRPGVAVMLMVLTMLLLGTVGSAGRARRMRRRQYGRRASDGVRGAARLPLDVLLSVLQGLLGVLLGFVAGALMYYVGEGLFANSRFAAELTAWASVGVGMFVAWLMPTSFVQRLGARSMLAVGRDDEAGRQRGSRGLRGALVLLSWAFGLLVVWGIVGGALPGVVWDPLPQPTPLGQLFVIR